MLAYIEENHCSFRSPLSSYKDFALDKLRRFFPSIYCSSSNIFWNSSESSEGLFSNNFFRSELCSCTNLSFSSSALTYVFYAKLIDSKTCSKASTCFFSLVAMTIFFKQISMLLLKSVSFS